MAGGEGGGDAVVTGDGEMRSLALTPTWSVATVLTLLVAGSLIIERSIHRLSNWLKKTHRNPLYKAMEKMKEEMMLLGFISLMLAATSRIISGICIDSKYYNSKFSPCTKAEVEESLNSEHALAREGKRLMEVILQHSLRRNLKARYHHREGCREGYESFVSHEGLEQLHRFIFVMAVTHVTYSCLTMLLAILKIHKWRKWEDEAFRDNHESFSQIAYVSATRRQPALAKSYSFRSWSQNDGVKWLFCFIAQFGQSVVRADYLILRKGFIMTHNLLSTYDFHNYMIRSMEEEFEKIVGVSGVLWGFVVAFMLFNIDGSNLYFWIAILPVALVLLVGAKLQYVIATLTAEGARMTAYGPRISQSIGPQACSFRLRLRLRSGGRSPTTTVMAATTNLAFRLPMTLPSRLSCPNRVHLLHNSCPAQKRLISAAAAAGASSSSSQTEPSPISSETPEARQIRLETEAALEWGGVCTRLADFAATAAGRAACGEGRVPVGRSPEESEKLIEQTAAAVLLSAPLDFGGVEDVSAVVAAAAGGRLLSVREICGVGRSIRAARRVFDQLQRLADEMPDGRYSPLLHILQGCDFLSELVERIEFCLDSTLSLVLDRASKKLETIRKDRRRNMEMLESLLKDTSVKIFQEGGIDSPVVTKRRSRMCVGVKASHKHLLPGGIILSSSGSGATYFMEPRDAVELNNREVKLSGDERAEELAILGLLTSRIAESRMKIRHLMGKVLELDLACARGSYAMWTNGVRPSFSDSYSSSQSDQSSDYSVYIEGIQHPLLLEKSLGMAQESTKMPVPLDMWVKNDTRIVVISGPNTGGKTATMKTLGLASLMSKAGMFFPAKGRPRLPWFDQVLADIGDHQSLEHSLSTFSGHISRLRKIVEVVSKDSLVLIDEIGSGTDPSEGVSLSTSILKYLAGRVNLAIVTTHYADLSHLQAVDNRFQNAAMEFCLETLQPTYRILWGSIGNSNALSIAKSIGFDQNVLDRAQEWVEKLLPDKQKERQGLLYDSLLNERNILELQANKVASVLSEVEELYDEIRSEAEDLDTRVATLRARESQKVQQELKYVKSQMDMIIKNFEMQLKNSKLEQFNSLMRKAEAATASVAAAHQPTDITFNDKENQSSFVPQIGDKVYIQGLGGGTMATIVETLGEDGSCMVQYGKIKLRVTRNKMKLVQRGTNEAAVSSSVKGKGRTPKRTSAETTQDANISFGPVVQTSKNTVDLRGLRVNEASYRLQMAIDACRPYQVLFVVHGMGTGAVKDCAIEILRNHPRVAKFEDESPLNYGCTVAYIQ